MNLVTLEQIRKQYSERLLLEDVGLTINGGDRVGLIGINGSGKSTLLRIVAGLEPPDAGRVTTWGGVRIHYLPQEPALDEGQTVLGLLLASDAPSMRLLRDLSRRAGRSASCADRSRTSRSGSTGWARRWIA